MKKVLLIAVVAVVFLANVRTQAQITGRPQVVKPAPPASKPMGARVLPITTAQKREFIAWQQLYGFTEEAHIYYNIAVLLTIADQHGTTINNNREYIGMILSQEDPNSLASLVVADHNSIKTLTEKQEKRNARVKELAYTIGLELGELRARVDALEEQIADSHKPDKFTEAEEEALEIALKALVEPKEPAKSEPEASEPNE